MRDDENLLFYPMNLDRSENLSISVQGLPGLRGPEGPQGNYVPFSFLSRRLFFILIGPPGPIGPRGLIGPPGKTNDLVVLIEFETHS